MTELGGKLICPGDVKPVCPPLHQKTDAVALASKKIVGARQFECFHVTIHDGGEGEMDVHENEEHAFYIISGEGNAIVEDETFELYGGDFLFIPKGARHSVRPSKGKYLEMIVLLAPARKS